MLINKDNFCDIWEKFVSSELYRNSVKVILLFSFFSEKGYFVRHIPDLGTAKQLIPGNGGNRYINSI
jgi:hypothetical protein